MSHILGPESFVPMNGSPTINRPYISRSYKNHSIYTTSTTWSQKNTCVFFFSFNQLFCLFTWFILLHFCSSDPQMLFSHTNKRISFTCAFSCSSPQFFWTDQIIKGMSCDGIELYFNRLLPCVTLKSIITSYTYKCMVYRSTKRQRNGCGAKWKIFLA